MLLVFTETCDSLHDTTPPPPPPRRPPVVLPGGVQLLVTRSVEEEVDDSVAGVVLVSRYYSEVGRSSPGTLNGSVPV